MEIADHVEYLSIGEVLSELKSEFDEVSISKIRFLESQGLIEPERTKSGYRRFYPNDVARLRWILRQQRDHFLPLKVIKARLDEVGDIDFEVTIAVQPNLWTGTDDDPNRLLREAEAAAEAAAAADAWESSTDDVAAAERNEHDTDVVAPRRTRQRSPKKKKRAPAVISDAAPIDAQTPILTTPSSDDLAPEDSAVATDEISVMVDPNQTTIDHQLVTPDDLSAMEAEPTSPARPEKRAASQPDRDPAAWLAALQEAPSESRSGRRSAREREREAEPLPFVMGRGLKFARSEVLEVAGVTEEQLSSMEEYGLVVATVIGGEATYDASSLAVVKSVAAFLGHGIEPRHLRMFKNAADREAGFYEQAVLPLLKQRNPRAAEQAVKTLSALATAGDELRRSLVQQALRSHFND